MALGWAGARSKPAPYPLLGAAALKTSRAFWILLCSGEAFIPSSRNHFSQCQALLNKITSVNPQTEIDGFRNIWIIKPAAKSRGRGEDQPGACADSQPGAGAGCWAPWRLRTHRAWGAGVPRPCSSQLLFCFAKQLRLLRTFHLCASVTLGLLCSVPHVLARQLLDWREVPASSVCGAWSLGGRETPRVAVLRPL